MTENLVSSATDHSDIDMAASTGETETCTACAICTDEMILCGASSPSSSFPLPCNHVFHADCIIPWLIRGTKACPLCRYELPTEFLIRVLSDRVNSVSESITSEDDEYEYYIEEMLEQLNYLCDDDDLCDEITDPNFIRASKLLLDSY